MHGLFPLYKEIGFTSFDAVAVLRGILHTRRIGHAGTLDPGAEGVLVILVGGATKLAEEMTVSEKEYTAVARLGIRTDTQDMTGRILETRQADCTEEEVRRVLAGFLGTSMQTPPMYSAKKVGGKKLYDLARSGIEVERKAQEIHISKIELLSFELPLIRFRVRCSKGTYVRTICEDAGMRLGCGAAMESLLRTECCGFTAAESLTLSEVRQRAEHGDYSFLRSTAVYYSDLPEVHIQDELQEMRLQSGNPIPFAEDPGASEVRVYDAGGAFTGIYHYDPSRAILTPRRLFWEGK